MNTKLSNFFRNRSIRSTVIWSNLLLIGLAILITIISFVALNKLLRNAEQSNYLVDGLSEINEVSGELKKYLQTRNIQYIDDSERLLNSIKTNMTSMSDHHKPQQSEEIIPLIDAMIGNTALIKTGFEQQQAENKKLQKTSYKLGAAISAKKRKAESERTQLLAERSDSIEIERAKQIALKNAYILQDRLARFNEILPNVSDYLYARQESQAKTALNNIVGPIESLHGIVDLAGSSALYAQIEGKISELQIGLKQLFKLGFGSKASIGDLDTVWQALKSTKTLVEKLVDEISELESEAGSIDSELARLEQEIQKQNADSQAIFATKNVFSIFNLSPSAEISTQRNQTISNLIAESLKTSALISKASVSSTQNTIDINKTASLLTAVGIVLAISNDNND